MPRPLLEFPGFQRHLGRREPGRPDTAPPCGGFGPGRRSRQPKIRHPCRWSTSRISRRDGRAWFFKAGAPRGLWPRARAQSVAALHPVSRGSETWVLWRKRKNYRVAPNRLRGLILGHGQSDCHRRIAGETGGDPGCDPRHRAPAQEARPGQGGHPGRASAVRRRRDRGTATQHPHRSFNRRILETLSELLRPWNRRAAGGREATE